MENNPPPRTNSRRLILCLLATVLSGCTAVPSIGTSRPGIHGRVADAATGRPVYHAIVSVDAVKGIAGLEIPPSHVFTAADGSFSISPILDICFPASTNGSFPMEVLPFSVVKPGYHPCNGEVGYNGYIDTGARASKNIGTIHLLPLR